MQHLALPCASDAPRSASKALQRSDAEEWHSAEKAEIASCLEQSTWHSCELPEGRQPPPSHFVYAQKRDGRYKARFVAVDHKQQQEIDFDETFAPVCSYRSVCVMLAVATHEGLELRQYDIKTAFSNGYLKKRCTSARHMGGNTWLVLVVCYAWTVPFLVCDRGRGSGINVLKLN
jgi:hypothetical protein